jgi:hypothetical protein
MISFRSWYGWTAVYHETLLDSSVVACTLLIVCCEYDESEVHF